MVQQHARCRTAAAATLLRQGQLPHKASQLITPFTSAHWPSCQLDALWHSCPWNWRSHWRQGQPWTPHPAPARRPALTAPVPAASQKQRPGPGTSLQRCTRRGFCMQSLRDACSTIAGLTTGGICRTGLNTAALCAVLAAVEAERHADGASHAWAENNAMLPLLLLQAGHL